MSENIFGCIAIALSIAFPLAVYILRKRENRRWEDRNAAHYWCCPMPWKDGSEYWCPADCDAVDRFLELGLLVRVNGHIEANHDALRPYMDALSAVPLPIQAWVIPGNAGAEQSK